MKSFGSHNKFSHNQINIAQDNSTINANFQVADHKGIQELTITLELLLQHVLQNLNFDEHKKLDFQERTEDFMEAIQTGEMTQTKANRFNQFLTRITPELTAAGVMMTSVSAVTDALQLTQSLWR